VLSNKNRRATKFDRDYNISLIFFQKQKSYHPDQSTKILSTGSNTISPTANQLKMFLKSAIVFVASTLALAHAFHVAPTITKTHASTSLAARGSMFPILRRSRQSLMFPDFDRMFEEMDEMMESSLATLPRSPLSRLEKTLPGDLQLRRPLGFEVTQNENEYKVSMHVPDVDVKDLDLQLDHDGRVLRLKGERKHQEGGMTVQSRFEKAILLSPDVDTTKLVANASGNTLTVVAPKIVEKDALEKFEIKKIDIHVGEPELQDSLGQATDCITAETHLAIENLKDQKVEVKKNVETKEEKKWPVKEFPY
jgi:HSP20 family molecular chaperone IbpA